MKYVSTFKAITLILIFCIADVYVLADGIKPNTSGRDAATNIAPSKLLLGRLFVPYHQEILVNGHSAMSGDTILSGSRLQTSGLPATVDIGSIAKLEIKPNTELMLTFDQTSVDVTVTAGHIALTTGNGVKGKVTMPDGKAYAMRTAADGQQPTTTTVSPPGGSTTTIVSPPGSTVTIDPSGKVTIAPPVAPAPTPPPTPPPTAPSQGGDGWLLAGIFGAGVGTGFGIGELTNHCTEVTIPNNTASPVVPPLMVKVCP